MEKWGLNEIRKTYLDFFREREHLVVHSFPLVPQNDNTLLIINAGMAPLKNYFSGTETPPQKRMASSQKCVRTPDIDRVGRTARHGTFFEMLGNFSFGDYFKREAINWAWEFSIDVLKMDESKIHISVHLDDDEAYEIWEKEMGIPTSRIHRLGEDNFWEIGVGPCGPCSELHYDRGIEHGCGNSDCAPGCDCDRFMEYWNLVFTQFDKDEQGNYNPLPNPNIDTGMGLERIAALMQGVNSLFEIDVVKPILEKVCEIGEVKYGLDPKTDMSIRVITDHIRTATFMIGDGILPSNEGRGYVLRRLMRRALRHKKLLTENDLSISSLVSVIDRMYGEAYSEIREKRAFIEKIIQIEEARFAETIDSGLLMLKEEILKVHNGVLDGTVAFKLYDTFGFPLDLTKDVLEEKGLRVDEDGFELMMKEQRERAREARKVKGETGFSKLEIDSLKDYPKTLFEGYDNDRASCSILAIVQDSKVVEYAQEGDEVTLILDRTTCYAEGGGQVGDNGKLTGSNFEVDILDTKKSSDVYLHHALVVKGNLSISDTGMVDVSQSNRRHTERNHTATHLLHKALKEVLGEHVEQAGSYVDASRLRFDFSHFQAMTEEELERVEEIVNSKILANLSIEWEIMAIEDAKNKGATALFGEKYGDSVRVVRTGDYSMELCGGTHVNRTGDIGLFHLLSESGIAAGVRRIEACTGNVALLELRRYKDRIAGIASSLKTKDEDLEQRVETLIKELKDKDRELSSLKSKMANSSLDDILASKQVIKDVELYSGSFEGLDMDSLRKLGDSLKDKTSSGVGLFLSSSEGKVNILCVATKEAVSKGIHSGNIVKEIANICGGGGGGRPDMAQAGGKDPSQIPQALKSFSLIVDNQIK